jgi:hypothetical protein
MKSCAHLIPVWEQRYERMTLSERFTHASIGRMCRCNDCWCCYAMNRVLEERKNYGKENRNR